MHIARGTLPILSSVNFTLPEHLELRNKLSRVRQRVKYYVNFARVVISLNCVISLETTSLLIKVFVEIYEHIVSSNGYFQVDSVVISCITFLTVSRNIFRMSIRFVNIVGILSSKNYKQSSHCGLDKKNFKIAAFFYFK